MIKCISRGKKVGRNRYVPEKTQDWIENELNLGKLDYPPAVLRAGGRGKRLRGGREGPGTRWRGVQLKKINSCRTTWGETHAVALEKKGP